VAFACAADATMVATAGIVRHRILRLAAGCGFKTRFPCSRFLSCAFPPNGNPAEISTQNRRSHRLARKNARRSSRFRSRSIRRSLVQDLTEVRDSGVAGAASKRSNARRRTRYWSRLGVDRDEPPRTAGGPFCP